MEEQIFTSCKLKGRLEHVGILTLGQCHSGLTGSGQEKRKCWQRWALLSSKEQKKQPPSVRGARVGGPVSVSGAGDGVAQCLPTAFPGGKGGGPYTSGRLCKTLSPTQPQPHLHMTATSPATWME